MAKTLADLFKYRNKIGLDVALEALPEAWRAKRRLGSKQNCPRSAPARLASMPTMGREWCGARDRPRHLESLDGEDE